MTRKIQLLRGTTAQNDAYTGSSGELTVDTTLNELRVHDGSTAGGHKIVNNNKNTANGAITPIYDWVGTLSEYTTQAVATNHPNWICYITDDFTSGAYDAYSKNQTDTLLANKVNIGHEVVAFQAPTAANNYTWYRKYADGWVEQGGKNTAITTGSTQTQTFPITMADTNYTVGITLIGTGLADTGFRIIDASNTTTAFAYNANSGDGTSGMCWEVKGMAA